MVLCRTTRTRSSLLVQTAPNCFCTPMKYLVEIHSIFLVCCSLTFILFCWLLSPLSSLLLSDERVIQFYFIAFHPSRFIKWLSSHVFPRLSPHLEFFRPVKPSHKQKMRRLEPIARQFPLISNQSRQACITQSNDSRQKSISPISNNAKLLWTLHNLSFSNRSSIKRRCTAQRRV
jgi:hypothetical protein